MSLFVPYEKVERWDHPEETSGIEIGWVYVQEKIDGANGQIFFHDDHIIVGKRSCIIARCRPGSPPEIGDGFRGLPRYIFNNECYAKFFQELKEFKNWTLHGEWLVKHTVNYAPQYQNVFWVFDVYNRKSGEYLGYEDYVPVLEEYNIPYIKTIGKYNNPNLNDLLDMVRVTEKIPKSNFGADMIEGLVFKNYDFINRFGNMVYMKATTKDFRETKKVIMPSGSRFEVEIALVTKYVQPARIEKIYQKMLDTLNHTPTMADVPQLMGMVLHDLITEDSWQMFMRDKLLNKSGGVINFGALKKACEIRTKDWYVTKLQERI